MFKIRALYAVFSLAALSLFHVLHIKGMVPFAAINILLLVIAPMGYVYPDRFTYVMIAVSWAILFPATIFIYKMDPLNAALPLVLFNGLQAGYMGSRNLIRREKKLWDIMVKAQEKDKARLSVELEKLRRFEENVKKRELAIVSLYDITKKLSAYLRFEEIFAAFSVFLKENFTFRKCNLFILRYEDDTLAVDRTYSVWQENAASDQGEKMNYTGLIKLVSDKFKERYISSAADRQAFRDLGLEQSEVDSLAVIPLLSEKRLVGILTVENLPKVDLERFAILSSQFALEIQKVLLYEIVEKMAVTDSLTGLYVRRYFSERLNEELQRSRKHRFPFALLMMDIDDFKSCNDTYGHLVGDVVLKDIARIIKENVREIDVISRYGGEEIAIALPETGEESARLVAERLRKMIEENVFKAYDEKVRITVSIGVSVYPKDGFEVKDLMEGADAALYAAKRQGKNLVQEYKKEYNGPA